jgi:hypothetical protein
VTKVIKEKLLPEFQEESQAEVLYQLNNKLFAVFKTYKKNNTAL